MATHKPYPQAVVSEVNPGTWRGCKRDGIPAANFCCPGCGLNGGIGHSTNHEISAGGVVTPSIDCEECSFHEWIKLDGWPEFLASAT